MMTQAEVTDLYRKAYEIESAKPYHADDAAESAEDLVYRVVAYHMSDRRARRMARFARFVVADLGDKVSQDMAEHLVVDAARSLLPDHLARRMTLVLALDSRWREDVLAVAAPN